MKGMHAFTHARAVMRAVMNGRADENEGLTQANFTDAERQPL
jgi:hypothetical protein